MSSLCLAFGGIYWRNLPWWPWLRSFLPSYFHLPFLPSAGGELSLFTQPMREAGLLHVPNNVHQREILCWPWHTGPSQCYRTPCTRNKVSCLVCKWVILPIGRFWLLSEPHKASRLSPSKSHNSQGCTKASEYPSRAGMRLKQSRHTVVWWMVTNDKSEWGRGFGSFSEHTVCHTITTMAINIIRVKCFKSLLCV
jgi:hypothetical protein